MGVARAVGGAAGIFLLPVAGGGLGAVFEIAPVIFGGVPGPVEPAAGAGTVNTALHPGHMMGCPAVSSGMPNFMPHVVQATTLVMALSAESDNPNASILISGASVVNEFSAAWFKGGQQLASLAH